MKNQKSIRYNWHQADETLLEGIFARGDRKVAKAIRLAYENGALLDAWTGTGIDRWVQAFADADSIWGFLHAAGDAQTGYSRGFHSHQLAKKFLWKEWERAIRT